MKGAIWSRRTVSVGQKLPPPQPAVTPSAARASIQSANVVGEDAGGMQGCGV